MSSIRVAAVQLESWRERSLTFSWVCVLYIGDLYICMSTICFAFSLYGHIIHMYTFALYMSLYYKMLTNVSLVCI